MIGNFPGYSHTCEVSVENGTAEVGDVVVLTEWQTSFPQLKVSVKADIPSMDETRVSELRNLIKSANELAAFFFGANIS